VWGRLQRYEGKFRNNKQHGVGVFVDVDGTVTAAEWIEGAISRTIPISHIGACQEEAAHASHLARSKKDLLLQMLKANAVVIEVRGCVHVCMLRFHLECSPFSQHGRTIRSPISKTS
jgi:hypothetical protein